MAQSDITAMKETLLAQQQLLQKLYAELDEEREASATAASEAMDMIVRLQGEKAAVKMEASHYKRMSEEKIGHAEASLEIFEEVMYEKEMEIASLEFQVTAYRNKLVTLGFDFNASDFEDSLPSSRIDQQQQHNGESDHASSVVRRLSSLPPIPLKNNFRSARKRDRSPSPILLPDMVPILESDTDHEHEVTSPSFEMPRKSVDYGHGTLDAYWSQIKRLDERVKVISEGRESIGEKCSSTLRSRRGKSCSVVSQASPKINCDLTYRVADIVNRIEGTSDGEAVVFPSCSGSVHDVFEVPQTIEKHNKKKASGHGKRRLQRWSSDADNRLTKPDTVSGEIIGSHVKDDFDQLKSMLTGNHEIKIPSPKETKDVDCNNAQSEFQKLHQRIDQLERETISATKEIMHEVNGEEHLRLLKDISSQLTVMETEIKSTNIQKEPPSPPKSNKRDNPLDPLQEAMVYFWI